MQKKINYVVKFRILSRMFFCKAQVAGQQMSSPPTLYSASPNGGGIWGQRTDSRSKTLFGMVAPLRTRGLRKVQKI